MNLIVGFFIFDVPLSGMLSTNTWVYFDIQCILNLVFDSRVDFRTCQLYLCYSVVRGTLRMWYSLRLLLESKVRSYTRHSPGTRLRGCDEFKRQEIYVHQLNVVINLHINKSEVRYIYSNVFQYLSIFSTELIYRSVWYKNLFSIT